MEIEEAIIPLHEPPVRKLRSWHVVCLLIMGVGAYWIHAWAAGAQGYLMVHVLDVGQGDATLITTADGKQILIDGGPDGTVLSALGRYLPSWDQDIDIVVASHKHSDHIAGLVEVLDRYQVSHIIQGMESYDTAIARSWGEAVGREGALVTDGVAGTVVDLGASTSLTVLFPFESRQGTTTKDANNDSVVLLLRHKLVTMLFVGDAEVEAERAMLIGGSDVRADVLKAGHHGSKTSSTPEFISAVSPQAVIISSGAGNRYGHPSPVTLTHLAEFGIPYYRTDTQGDVTVTSDGRSFTISTQF